MKTLFSNVKHDSPSRSLALRASTSLLPCAAALFSASLLGASPARADDWPMHRHDPARTGASAETLKLPFKRAWALKTNAQSIISSAAVVGNTVYFGTRDKLDAPDAPPKPAQIGGGVGSLYAVDAATGKVKWRFNKWGDQGIGWVDSSPAVVGDRVYFAARDNYFYCIGTDGKQIWRTNTGGLYSSSSPVVLNGRIYVSPGAPKTDFISLRADNGEILWRTNSEGLPETAENPKKVPQFSYSSPALSGNRVYTAATNGIFYALNTQSGAIEWKFNTNGIVYYFTPSLAQGRLYVAGGELDPNLYAVDLNTGERAWTFTADHTKSFFISSTAVANDTVYIGMGVPDQVLYAVNATTGAERWRFKTGFSTVQGFTSSPSVAGNLVIVGSGPENQNAEPSGRVYAIDAKTGAPKWSDKLAAPVIASPAISGHRFFVGTMDGTMVAYQDATFSAKSPKAKPRTGPTRPKTSARAKTPARAKTTRTTRTKRR